MLDYEIYLEEIISMINKVEETTSGLTFGEFVSDINLFDATLMRIHFVGETIKNVPYSLRKEYKEVRWKKFSRLRNIISHKYGKVNKNIIWDVVKSLSQLKEQIEDILNKS
jgi:uncharacterized protein with HEPN domain